MKPKLLAILLISVGSLLLFSVALARPVQAQTGADPPIWVEQDGAGNAQIHLYFFWSETCPHCLDAYPFVTALPEQYPWLILHDLEVTKSQANTQRYIQMAADLGQEARFVPGFIFCEQLITGYESAASTGKELVTALTTCQVEAQARFANAEKTEPPQPEAAVTGVAVDEAVNATVTLPWLGEVDTANLSLPILLLTIILFLFAAIGGT